MSWLLNRLTGKAMSAFVAHGVGLDDEGRLCLPDGLTPDRVQRFIELCLERRFENPRAAMHALFGLVGVSARTIAVLEQIIHEGGDVDLGAAAQHWVAVAKALPGLHQIPVRFRRFLVDELGIADPASRTLEAAVVSTRRNAAQRLGCEPDWDQILELPEGLAELTADWRGRRGRPAAR